MSPQRASCTSITRIRSLLIVTWTMQQRRRYSLNRQPQSRRNLLNHPIPMLGGVAMLISLAIIDSRKLLFPFLFREALFFNSPPHGARRSVPLTPRLEWQDERRSFCFPPPVGAGIQSRGVKGARPGAHQRTFSLSTRRTFSLSSDTENSGIKSLERKSCHCSVKMSGGCSVRMSADVLQAGHFH